MPRSRHHHAPRSRRHRTPRCTAVRAAAEPLTNRPGQCPGCGASISTHGVTCVAADPPTVDQSAAGETTWTTGPVFPPPAALRLGPRSWRNLAAASRTCARHPAGPAG